MFPLHDVRHPRTSSRMTLQLALHDSLEDELHRRRESQTSGGARRDRTDDLMLAKHALSQLSYGPIDRNELVEPDGIEPTTSCLQSTRSRQLSYGRRALLRSQQASPALRHKMVGLGRLELPTSRLSSARSNQLSYKPELARRDLDARGDANRMSARPGRKRNEDGDVPQIGPD